MRTFTSKDASHNLSHPSLEEAAGSAQFMVRFRGGKFATDNDALADALVALNVAGIVETTPSPIEQPPAQVAKAPKKAKKDEE